MNQRRGNLFIPVVLHFLDHFDVKLSRNRSGLPVSLSSLSERIVEPADDVFDAQRKKNLFDEGFLFQIEKFP